MQKQFSKIKIFITRDIPAIGIELLHNEGFNVTVWPHDRPVTAEAFISHAKQSDVVISLSSDKLDANFLNACNHLQLISQFAAGYDNIDIDTATKLGIPVANTPNAMSDATADIAFGLMINVSRKMFFMHKKIQKNEWDFFRPKANLGFELKNKTLGIFGLGKIGMEMAKRCKGAYNMNIIYCNRNRNEDAEKMLDAQFVTFEELLKQSDVLSVHSVLSEETKGIFDKHAFAKMKPTAIFINTARGGIHNEEDLAIALIEGKICGAGLDVTNPEPMRADNVLLKMENVAILPHIGSASEEARNEMSRLAAYNVIEFYKNNNIPNIVNAEVLKC